MSGKKAKLARKAIRAAGGEDRVTRQRRIAREEEARREQAANQRAAAEAAETPEQRAARLEEMRQSARTIGGFLASIGMLGLALPAVGSFQRQPRFKRRGR